MGRVATLRVTIATPSPRARMNARERGAVLIPTRRQPWCRARSLSQPLNRLQVVATKMDARVATLRATTATPMVRAVMNARARGVVLQHQLQRRRQLRREVVATKMDARVATLRATIATPMIRAVMNARARSVVLQHQLQRRRQRRREVVATKMDARVATLRVTTATPSPRARMNARERGVVLIPT